MTRAAPEASPFHAGELWVQERAGLRERAELLGNMFRPAMPDQHRQFFAELPFVFVGSVDDAGQPWASMLIGEPGFIGSPDPTMLVVHARPFKGDPLAQSMREGARLGLLGIQLETRRRNRANGHVSEVGTSGFALEIDQSFGNCPKYIHRRHAEPLAATPAGALEIESARLSDAVVACIQSADTCFIASVSAGAGDPRANDPREGVDISHRGGARGFVEVRRSEAATTLCMPDYAGNNAFNTLGNLARYPRAGLLFPDFERGDLLQLACETEIIWEGPELARFEAAKRVVRFSVKRGLRLPSAMPFRWSALDR